MNYPDCMPDLVVVDAERRRYRLLVPVPSDKDPERDRFVKAIQDYVRFFFSKYGKVDPGSFKPDVGTPDSDGWYNL